MSEETFYVEFYSLGGQVKVSAIDPETGIEVSIIAPHTATQAEMSKVAVDKLKHRLRTTGESSANDEKTAPRNGAGRGILV